MIPDLTAIDYLPFLIQRGGQRAGVQLRPCPNPGTEEAGEWTYRSFSNGKGGETIVLYYWKGPNQPDSDEFLLQFPKTAEDQEVFSDEIARKITALAAKLKPV